MKVRIHIFIIFMFITTIGFAQEGIPTYDDQSKRDPLWPLVTSTGAIMNYDDNILVSDMILEGVIEGAGGKNVAIINGIIVEEETTMGNYFISEISQNFVTLIKDNEKFVLKLKKEE